MDKEASLSNYFQRVEEITVGPGARAQRRRPEDGGRLARNVVRVYDNERLILGVGSLVTLLITWDMNRTEGAPGCSTSVTSGFQR